MSLKVFNKPQMILMALQLILRAKLRPEMTPDKWIQIVLLADYKGYLYYGFEDDKLALISLAYRVKEVTAETNYKIPEREEGDILFVAFFISFLQDKTEFWQIINNFIKDHSNVNKIVFESRKNGLRTYQKEADKWVEKKV